MDMRGTARLHGAPPAVMLAKLIKRMKDAIGLTGSIGLSHNKFLAKVASDLEKPRGFSIIGKFLINPIAVIFAALVLNTDPLFIQVALIFAALPTGVASYTLAREMQGDAPLMAAIITMQTLLSFIILPLTLLLGQVVFSWIE